MTSRMDYENLDKLTARELKSSEQLKRHSIDTLLEGRAIDRAVHIFTVGEEVQKLSIVQSIPELLAEDPVGCMQSIVPKMQQSLVGGSTEYQVTASRTVMTILKEGLISMDSFVSTFLPTILCSMDNRDLVVVNAWTETLIEAIKLLPVDVLRRQIGPVAVSRSQMGRSVNVRLSSCCLLGELATRYDVNNLKKDLLPTIISLCQDVDGEVRANICLQLQKVLPQLRNEPNKTTILSSLIELAADEMIKVKEAAFITSVEVLPVIGIDVVKSTMVPLIKQLVNFAFKIDDNLVPTVSEHFGKMCLGLDKAIGPDRELFVKYFVTLGSIGMSHSKKPEKSPLDALTHLNLSSLTPEKFVICRRNCASNFPAMCKFAYEENSPTLLELLHTTLSDLITDPYFMVRRTIANGIGEVCTHLGKYNHLLKHDFLQLLYDEAEEVLEAFVPNITLIIEAFIKTGVYKNEMTTKENVVDLTRAILKCEGLIVLGHNWRLYSSFVDQIIVMYKINSCDTLFNNFVTLFFKRLHNTRVVPVRLAIMKLILTFLRYLPKPQQKTEIRNRILNEFCQSNSFYNRMFYVRSCYLIFEIFSTAYFKEHFFFRTLQLVDDPVPNIRWAMLMMLPRLKQMVKQPTEKKMAALVDNAFVRLSEDKDREIMAQIPVIKPQLDAADLKFFPNETKKLEEEKKLASVEIKSDKGGPQQFGPGTPPNIRAVQAPGPSTAVRSTPTPRSTSGSTSSTAPPRRSGNNTPSPSARSSINPRGSGSAPLSLDSVEFLIDAGIQLPSPKSQSASGQQTSDKSPPSSLKKVSRNIPVLRVNKPNNGKNNNENRKNSADTKRHSIDVVDLNKNITKRNINDITTNGSTINRTNDRKQSHLPRPLSCINFPTKNNETSSIPVSRLPVSCRFNNNSSKQI